MLRAPPMGVTMLRSPAAYAAIASLSLLAASGEALAVPRSASEPLPSGPSPVAFSIEPVPGTWQWRWSLRNVSSSAIEVAADRRLVWFEVPPPPIDPSVPRWRRRRVAPVRCVFETRPAGPESATRTELRPGERYSELVDLRDVCRLRVPTTLAAGAPVVAHYGYEPVVATGRNRASRSRWMARTLVPDLAAYPVNDLTATVTVPAGEVTAMPPSTPVALIITASNAQGAVGAGLRVGVSLRNATTRPLWTLFRNSLFTFEIVTPSGRRVACEGLLREPTPFREFFVRLGGNARRVASLAPAEYCPLHTFDEAGIYNARAVFRSNANGEPWATERVFTGRVTSAPFVLRVSRGDGRYRPLGLEVSG